jgi:hypothetical protein
MNDAQSRSTPSSAEVRNALTLRYLGIFTYRESIVLMRADCHICRAVGFTVQSRVQVSRGARTIIATVNMIGSDLLADGEASLSEAAWQRWEQLPAIRSSCHTRRPSNRYRPCA